MVPELRSRKVPKWLRRAVSKFGRLRLRKLLKDSVYYPACRFDGKPVKHLAGNYHSFVPADYGVPRDETFRQLTTFAGYYPVYVREVTKDELAPKGWHDMTPEAHDWMVRFRGPQETEFFALWAIMERSQGFLEEHGPDRFSFLYIGSDGVTTFSSIYSGNNIAPDVIAIVHPGGFGGNWTEFENEDCELAQAVLGNRAGVPTYLLNDARGQAHACWRRSYPGLISALPNDLRLWGQAVRKA
jgi:hypothetical protein